MNKKAFINKSSSPRNVVGDLRLIKLLYKKAFSLFNTTKSAEDSPQRHWGMTLCYEQRAFTLIELLVVVLIIGILSAIALPQYQKAIMKTRYAIMKPIVRHMYEAEKLYYLANGEYADTFDKLGVEIAGQTSDTKSLIFPWGFCTIESGYVYCYNYQLTMAYYISFNDERWCLTYDADKQYPLRHQICQADTGNTPNSGGDYQYL